MSKVYTQYRVFSDSRRDLWDGLPSGIAMGRPPFTHAQLSELTAEGEHFYIDSEGMLKRGEERYTEVFHLEGWNKRWWIIKVFQPLFSSDPNTTPDVADHDV